MDDNRRYELRDSFLQHLQIFRRVQNPDSSLFGTLIDSWYAYQRGGVFVKPTGNPRTLNNPSGRLEREAMRQLPFVSQAAGKILHENHTGRLVREHSIPKAYLRELFMTEVQSDAPTARIETWLLRRYHVAALTKEEHDTLPDRHKMPVGWDGDDVWARYLGISEYILRAR